ncbi:MAG: hypothetical protein M3Y68_05495, partial [Chloroflexota bacterium]|nr:hypothetical protein [Chloroflexota bacterium]
VITKATCNHLDPAANPKNIVGYRNVITRKLPEFAKEMIYLPRFNLKIKPWYHWTQGKTPPWWDSYNKVKHERNEYFAQANLKNVLYSMGGLLVAEFYFHKLKFQSENRPISSNKDVTELLIDESQFLKLPDDYYATAILWD